MEKFEQYIIDWKNKEWKKLQNEQEFLIYFADYLDKEFLSQEFDIRDISFDWEGSYFWVQIRIDKDSIYRYWRNVLRFEISFDKEKISIYDGNHEWFWVPEYAVLTKDMEYFNIIKDKLSKIITIASWLNLLV